MDTIGATRAPDDLSSWSSAPGRSPLTGRPERGGEGEDVSIRGKAFVAGIYEHPRREIPDRSTSQIHAEVCGRRAGRRRTLLLRRGRLLLRRRRPDSGRCRWPTTSGCGCTHVDSTETGGSSYVVHVGHAAEAIAAGKCTVALITLAGRPRTGAMGGRRGGMGGGATPDMIFEGLWGMAGAVTGYALAAQRHMYEFGTTSEQLAEVKVAASLHAQYNPQRLPPRRRSPSRRSSSRR